MFQQATRRACEDAKMSTSEIDSVVYGIYNDIFEHQAIPESSLTGLIGMANKPGTRVTSGGATGFYAMRTAYHGSRQRHVASACSASVARRQPTASTRARRRPRRWSSTPSPRAGTPSSSTRSARRPATRTCRSAWPTTTTTPATSATRWCAPRSSRCCAGRATATPTPSAATRHVTVEQVMNSRWIIAPFLRLLEVCMYTEGAGAIIFASREEGPGDQRAHRTAHHLGQGHRRRQRELLARSRR